MKINLENMKEIAEKLDSHKSLMDLNINEDIVMSMAYQLQYFFEQIEYLDSLSKGKMSKRLHSKEYIEGYTQGVKTSHDFLRKAVIDK